MTELKAIFITSQAAWCVYTALFWVLMWGWIIRVSKRARMRRAAESIAAENKLAASQPADPYNLARWAADRERVVTGDMPLADFLDKWSGRAPRPSSVVVEFPVEKRIVIVNKGGDPEVSRVPWGRSLLDAVYRPFMYKEAIEQALRIGERIYGRLPEEKYHGAEKQTTWVDASPPKFKVGQWVRIDPASEGRLGRVVSGPNPATMHYAPYNDRRVYYTVTHEPNDLGLSYNTERLEPALPRKGEWWAWPDKPCFKCHEQGAPPLSSRPFQPINKYPGESWVERAALCGCLFPVNFGKGRA